MSGRLREIARQTVPIAEAGSYEHPDTGTIAIATDVAAAISGTRHFLPSDAVAISGIRNDEPQIEVTRESTLVAARRLGDDAATLVFASAKNPGGGFLGGAEAQEESLARSSALYPCLLTAAAPNLGAILRNQPENAASVPEVLATRAARVLEVAAAHGHRTLVLGAWGCGVFRNDPSTVARAFASALKTVNYFDRVVFAIYDRVSGTPVHAAFAACFQPTVN